ncbi:helix-turn-helix protein [Stackebrandtia albiflava]|uniref:Helix-turn-helix protein n=1 Tax=Stackebrandtia albiflava TaxID=406432 RepID=A0A562V1R2_9ACTN|nr:helix-turn-helix domain-containing protein [Stackebrandtia albiflava]TWJ11752.1 helix-turn-helix protein [Stackebrandtia albiflava]
MAERDIGGFIRDMRRNAKVSLRQLADQAGVSNPYLSQIERGLRKPSAEVLQQIANALKVSTPLMYLRAGLLNQKDGQGTLAAIAADPGLTTRQKQTLSEIYEAFRRENIRNEGTDLDDDMEAPVVFDADVAAVADDLYEAAEAEQYGRRDDDAPERPQAVPEPAEPGPTEPEPAPTEPAARAAGRPARTRARRRTAAPTTTDDPTD